MTRNAMPDDRQLALAPLDENVDHVRGSRAGRLIVEYGDYECPYSCQAFRAIEHVEQQLGGNLRFAFRHFPLTSIHPHALAAAAAAEAAARQGRFWDMHELLFHRQKALEDGAVGGTGTAQPGRGGVRPGPGQQRGGGADPPGCGQRPGFGPGAGHSPPCSSTAWCTAGATTRAPCWRHWHHEGDRKPRRSLTMIAVTRPGVITLLMMRMLFTPLGTP